MKMSQKMMCEMVMQSAWLLLCSGVKGELGALSIWYV